MQKMREIRKNDEPLSTAILVAWYPGYPNIFCWLVAVGSRPKICNNMFLTHAHVRLHGICMEIYMSDVKKISDWTLKWLHEMTRDDNTSDLLETLFKPPKKIPKNVFFQHVNYRFPQGGAPPSYKLVYNPNNYRYNPLNQP